MSVLIAPVVSDAISVGLEIDAAKHSEPAAFQAANKATYEALIHIWYNIALDMSDVMADMLLANIKLNGLEGTISSFSSLSEKMLSENKPVFTVSELTFLGKCADSIAPASNLVLFRCLLQYLRFGKRFAPRENPELEDISYQKFYDLQKEIKESMRTWSDIPVLYKDIFRSFIQNLLPWNQIIRRTEEYLGEPEYNFSPGVSYNTNRSVFSKVIEALKSDNTFLPPIGSRMVTLNNGIVGGFPDHVYVAESKAKQPEARLRWGSRHWIPQPVRERVQVDGKTVRLTMNTSDLVRERRQQQWVHHSTPLNSQDYPVRYAKLLAVPKTYKSHRMIAPENALRQARARVIADFLAQEFPDFLGSYSQERNQLLAKQGATTGNYVTFDLSAASDSVTAQHLSLFPPRVQQMIEPFLPTHFVDARRPEVSHLLYSAATMGNGFTFRLVELVISGIVAVAVHVLLCFKTRRTPTFEDLLDYMNCYVAIYGDDIIVPDEMSEILEHMLQLFGFTVNEDKSFTAETRSFWDGAVLRFRESCGVDVLMDVQNEEALEVTSVYWPRKFRDLPVKDFFTDEYEDSISSYVKLSNALRSSGWLQGASAAESWVFHLFPEMTRTPTNDTSDLFGDPTSVHIARKNPAYAQTDPGYVPEFPGAPWLAVKRWLSAYPVAVADTDAIKKQFPKASRSERMEKETIPKQPVDSEWDWNFAVDLFNRYKYYKFLKDGPSVMYEFSYVYHLMVKDDDSDNLKTLTSHPIRTLVSESPGSFSAFIGLQKLIWKIGTI
jgi:hypothetical protein